MLVLSLVWHDLPKNISRFRQECRGGKVRDVLTHEIFADKF